MVSCATDNGIYDSSDNIINVSGPKIILAYIDNSAMYGIDRI